MEIGNIKYVVGGNLHVKDRMTDLVTSFGLTKTRLQLSAINSNYYDILRKADKVNFHKNLLYVPYV